MGVRWGGVYFQMLLVDSKTVFKARYGLYDKLRVKSIEI